MTREEAYNRIDAIIAKHEIDDEYVTITNSKDYDALRIARKALKQEPKFILKSDGTIEQIKIEHESKTVNKYCDAEKLNYIREYIVNNIMRESDIMNNEDCRNVVDLPEVIASLYELLHLIVTGEPYEYMFHWANKCGSWVENDLFTEQYDRRCEK